MISDIILSDNKRKYSSFDILHSENIEVVFMELFFVYIAFVVRWHQLYLLF